MSNTFELLKKIPKKGDLPEPTIIFGWDVMVDGKEYVVGKFEGYAHTISYSRGVDSIEDLYCWPRGEEPTRENILEYHMPYNGPIDWGIRYDQRSISKHKYDETETCPIGMITITRNGKDFYKFRGDMNIGIDHARCIIERIESFPINFNAYDYINKEIIGGECYFYGYKAKISHWCDGQGCAILECAEEDPERRKEALAKWEAAGCEDGEPKVNVIDPYPGTGFQWYNN